MSAQEITVPDIGDFSDIPVIEIHVAAGDTVAAEDPLVTLESDKATLDVPAPVAGTVTELRVAVGDTVSEGSVIMVIDAEGGDAAPAASATAPTQQVTETVTAQPAAAATAPPVAAANIERGDQHAEDDGQHDAVNESSRENGALLAFHFGHGNAGCDILRRDHLAHHSAG